MAKNYFNEELKKNRIAEVILFQVLKSMDNNIKIEDVSGNKDCFHKGDVRALKGDKWTYFDAKNDKSIAKTRNVFCEEYKYFHRNVHERCEGFMENSEYDYLAIVSQAEKKIYMLDFWKLKDVYKDFRKVECKLSDAISYGRVIPLSKCREFGILRMTIDYDFLNGKYSYLNICKEHRDY